MLCRRCPASLHLNSYFARMKKYSLQKRFLFAVDCIIFGFDGKELKLLVIQRSFEPFKGKWSLIGGFVTESESAEDAASRVLEQLTGLNGLYMEQLHVFSQPERDHVERTVSVAFFALIDLQRYRQQLNPDYHAVWVSINDLPQMIFDHNTMVEMAKEKLRYKAALHPLLLELLPARFTLPDLQSLYESVYNIRFDKGNFSRKIIATGLLIKQQQKDREGSKKGAFYYKIDAKKYATNFHKMMNLVPVASVNQ